MDSGRAEPRINSRRTQQAADWFIRLSDDDDSGEEIARWLGWCRDPANQEEFQQLSSMWSELDRLRPEALELLNGLMAERPERSFSLARLFPFGGWATRIAVVALSGLLATAGGWFAYEHGLFSTPQNISAQAVLRAAVLPDGSRMVLAPETQVTVDFHGGMRNLQLHPGEAYFEVQADKSRPFVVSTEKIAVTAVGTAFDVRTDSRLVTVTVREGSVNVTAFDGARSDQKRWHVVAGYQAEYVSSTHSMRISAVDTDHALSWREGRLQFVDESLTAVVAAVNRYTGRRIEIGDSQVGALTFTGTVFTDSTDDWLRALENTFGLRPVATQDNRIILKASP